jgi:hypothetical protein
MPFKADLHRIVLAASTALLLSASPNLLAADFPTTVTGTHPIAYYRLNTAEGKSLVGNTTYKPTGGVSQDGPGAPVGADSQYAKFNGKDGFIVSTQTGGVHGAASMMAWVNLAALPSTIGHFFYVMGESQNGNDLDLQFENDNQLKFYTAAGGHVTYVPAPDTLLNQWHFVVVTLDTKTKTRVIYWDGKPVANDKGSGAPNKSGAFSIGASTVFSGRFFGGGIQEVALWDRALSAKEVETIYAASTPAGEK